jgi:hypothetical protein
MAHCKYDWITLLHEKYGKYFNSGEFPSPFLEWCHHTEADRDDPELKKLQSTLLDSNYPNRYDLYRKMNDLDLGAVRDYFVRNPEQLSRYAIEPPFLITRNTLEDIEKYRLLELPLLPSKTWDAFNALRDGDIGLFSEPLDPVAIDCYKKEIAHDSAKKCFSWEKPQWAWRLEVYGFALIHPDILSYTKLARSYYVTKTDQDNITMSQIDWLIELGELYQFIVVV